MDNTSETTERFSARRLVAANAAIVFSAVVAYSLVLRHGSFILGMILTFPFLLGASLVPQVLIPSRFKRHAKVRVAAFLLPALALALGVVVPAGIASIPSVKTRNILKAARLAPLPESASNVRVSSWAAGFAFEAYLRFEAPKDAVADFIAASPALRGETPEEVAAAYMARDPSAPAWFTPEREIRGRLYTLHGEGDSWYGQLVVSGDGRRVYVWLGD